MRNPAPGTWSLADRPGSLALHGGPATLNDVAAPAFVGRRQEHWDVYVRTRMDLNPTADGDEAGLTMYYNEEHHYEVAVTRTGGVRRLIVRRRVGDLAAVVADQLTPDGPVELAIRADKFVYHIGHQTDGKLNVLATGRTQFLSCEAAPVGFTGVYFALYATGNGKPASGKAYFDWFDYQRVE